MPDWIRACAPACINLKTFPVRVQDGQVWIEV